MEVVREREPEFQISEATLVTLLILGESYANYVVKITLEMLTFLLIVPT